MHALSVIKRSYIIGFILAAAVIIFTHSTTYAAIKPTDTGSHWASNEISSAASEGWAYVENGKFNPNKAATREEVIWMLIGAIKTVELEGFDINKEDCLCDFLDQPSSWAAGRMGIAVGNGIIQGYPDGTLKPKSNITRAEFAVIISRLINEDTPSVFSPFWDYIPQWALPGIKKTYSKGIIKGYPDKSFGARRNVTKAEALVMIKRWKSKYSALSTSDTIPSEFKEILKTVDNTVCEYDTVYYSPKGNAGMYSADNTILVQKTPSSYEMLIKEYDQKTLEVVKQILVAFYPENSEEVYNQILLVIESGESFKNYYDERLFSCFKQNYINIDIGFKGEKY